jgi:hypothetical protein
VDDSFADQRDETVADLCEEVDGVGLCDVAIDFKVFL